MMSAIVFLISLPVPARCTESVTEVVNNAARGTLTICFVRQTDSLYVENGHSFFR